MTQAAEVTPELTAEELEIIAALERRAADPRRDSPVVGASPRSERGLSLD